MRKPYTAALAYLMLIGVKVQYLELNENHKIKNSGNRKF